MHSQTVFLLHSSGERWGMERRVGVPTVCVDVGRRREAAHSSCVQSGKFHLIHIVTSLFDARDSGSAHKARDHVGVAELNGQIYVVGGREGHTCLSTVERFDPQVRLDVRPHVRVS